MHATRTSKDSLWVRTEFSVQPIFAETINPPNSQHDDLIEQLTCLSIIMVQACFHLGVFLVPLLLPRQFTRLIEVHLTRSMRVDRETRHELLKIRPVTRWACEHLVSR